MISINDFLRSKGLSPNVISDHVKMEDVINYIKEYSTMVRDEQITYCAVGAAHYTALTVRSAPSRLNSDLEEHKKVCKVKIE